MVGILFLSGCGNLSEHVPKNSSSSTKLVNGRAGTVEMRSDSLQNIDSLIQKGISLKAFPGAVVLVVRHGVVVKNSAYGFAAEYINGNFVKMANPVPMHTDTIFDIASLTKLFTAVAAMKLYEEGKLSLDMPVAKYIPQFASHGKEKVTIRMLLTHTSGFEPGIPLWKENKSIDERIQTVYNHPLQNPPGTVYQYSDLNMITLGKVIQTVSGEPLDEFIRRNITVPLRMKDTMFNPPASSRQRIAATEYQPWTKRGMVWGQVHDENAWSLGGVSGHAGIFSTAYDLAIFSQMILNGGSYDGVQILKPETVRLMEEVQTLAGHEHALGWEINQPWYMGGLASTETFGHTGFTGTSIVVDKKDDVICIFLTNRVHPVRTGPSINPYRAGVADDVAQSIGK